MKLKLGRNNKVLLLLKLSVSLGLIAYLIWLVDWERAVTTLSQAAKWPLFIAPFLYWIGFGLAAFRWRLILQDGKVTFSYRRAYTGYLVGMFYNIFLPGTIGGDAVRVGRCVRQTHCQIGPATAAVLLERISGVLVLMMLVLTVLLLFPATLSPLLVIEGTSAVMVMAAAGIIGIFVVLLGRRIWLSWLPPSNGQGIWDSIRSSLEMVGHLRGRTLAMILMLSSLHQIIVEILIACLFSQALGLDVPLPAFFAIIPLVFLTAVLPISLGGLGVREGVLVLLLTQFGVLTSDVVTLSFLIYLNRLVVGGLGGLVQLKEVLSQGETPSPIGNVNARV